MKPSNASSGFQRTRLLKPDVATPPAPTDARWLMLTTAAVRVPDKETTYWCHVTRLPAEFGRKHHVIQVEAVIQPGRESLVHHMEVRGYFISRILQSHRFPKIGTKLDVMRIILFRFFFEGRGRGGGLTTCQFCKECYDDFADQSNWYRWWFEVYMGSLWTKLQIKLVHEGAVFFIKYSCFTVRQRRSKWSPVTMALATPPTGPKPLKSANVSSRRGPTVRPLSNIQR